MNCLFRNRIRPIEEPIECPICLDEIKFFSKKKKLKCRCIPSRYFHKKCINTWLKLKDVCPLCDSKVERELGFWERLVLGGDVFDPCDFEEEEMQNNIIEQIEEVLHEDELAREQVQRDRELRERTLRERTLRENTRREQIQREHAIREYENRETLRRARRNSRRTEAIRQNTEQHGIVYSSFNETRQRIVEQLAQIDTVLRESREIRRNSGQRNEEPNRGRQRYSMPGRVENRE